MAKITLDPITGSFASVTALNSRFQQVEDAFNDNVFWRLNIVGEPNTLSNDLDMGTNDILNAGSISGDTIIIGGIDLATQVAAAAASAAAAAVSETNAEASYDSFDDRYLGSKASTPSLDNDGDALLTGAIYWNSVTDNQWTWTGSVWQLTTSSVATSANLISIADVGGYFIGTDVEAALQECAVASTINITDTGGYYTGTDVEVALQELGAAHNELVILDTPIFLLNTAAPAASSTAVTDTVLSTNNAVTALIQVELLAQEGTEGEIHSISFYAKSSTVTAVDLYKKAKAAATRSTGDDTADTDYDSNEFTVNLDGSFNFYYRIAEIGNGTVNLTMHLVGYYKPKT